MNIDIYQRLTTYALRLAPADGDFLTETPSLSVHRRHAMDRPAPCVYPRGLIVPLGGRKQAVYGDQIVNYERGSTLIVTSDLPVISQILAATAQSPSLLLFLKLDSAVLVEAVQVLSEESWVNGDASPLSIAAADDGLINALIRLLELNEEPHLRNSLTPLIEREIALRLVSGAHGPALHHMLVLGSPQQKIGSAMRWLRDNFTEKTTVGDLAAQTGMSQTNFRQYFREISGLSPMQYQKQLRLQAARQIMLNDGANVTSALIKVGYVSNSQFSREYKRLFGIAPLDDIARHKHRSR